MNEEAPNPGTNQPDLSTLNTALLSKVEQDARSTANEDGEYTVFPLLYATDTKAEARKRYRETKRHQKLK